MNKVFEKIIEKLEEIETHCLEMNDWQGQSAIVDSIEIVKHEAEKFGSDINVGSNGWIPCSERLPEECMHVLVQDYNGNYEIGICEKRKFNNYVIGIKSGDWWTWANNYIAWQRLPEPYQPKGE